MKPVLIIGGLVAIAVAACRSGQVVDPADYSSSFLETDRQQGLVRAQEHLGFWKQKLASDTASFVNLFELGMAHVALFELGVGNEHLEKGDSLVKLASAKLKDKDAELTHARVQLAATRHGFSEAASLLKQAEGKGSAFLHSLLSFDINMETGNFLEASRALDQSRRESFDYMIRKAKWEDAQGRIDVAIEWMEKALQKVEMLNSPSLRCWTKSILGEMYGHAGLISKSYRSYLDVLTIDADYTYALKGLAWIAYSHDHNAGEAKRILKHILAQHPEPGYWLMLSEIAVFEGDTAESERCVNMAASLCADPSSGNMFNKYLLEILVHRGEFENAKNLALSELGNRSTPEVWSWLANVYLHQGNKKEAYSIYRERLNGQSYEPEVLLVSAQVLDANGFYSEAKRIYNDCLESGFELGPVKVLEIEQRVEKLPE